MHDTCCNVINICNHNRWDELEASKRNIKFIWHSYCKCAYIGRYVYVCA